MNAQDILQSYQKVQSKHGINLPPLKTQTYSLDIITTVMDRLDDIHAKLDSFNPFSGWIGYQSGNQHFIKSLVIKQDDDHGILLNAELAGANTSLHVRYNGNGGWIVTTYMFSVGGEYVADEIKHIASFSKDDNTKLRYLRFWKTQDGAIGIHPVFACFIGFGG